MQEHKVNGEVFLALNDEYLRELAPGLGDRLKMKRVIAATLAGKSPVSYIRVFGRIYLRVPGSLSRQLCNMFILLPYSQYPTLTHCSHSMDRL